MMLNLQDTHHLQKREVAKSHVVEVNFYFGPVELGVIHGLAISLVVDQAYIVDVSCPVDTFPEFPSKKIDAHDAKYEPEDQAHQ